MSVGPSSNARRLLPFAALLLCAQAKPAPEPDASQVTVPSPEVLVTGERLSPAERRDRVVAYVRHTGIAAGDIPTARWIDAICLKVVGLPDAATAAVIAQVRDIALAAGARLAQPGCRTNAIIAFTDDGAAAVREIAKKRSTSLQEVSPAARSVLASGSDPVRWWYSTRAYSSEGDGADGGAPAHIRGEGSATGASLPGNMDTSFQTVRGSSVIQTESIRGIYTSNVIVDVKQLRGVGLESVTDYAAFVTLAEVRPRLTGQPDSILGVFADATASRRRLTDWDALLLKALYRLKLDRTASMQRGALTAALDHPKPRD